MPSLRLSFTKDNVLHNATTQIRILLERFANGKSMDIIIDAINALIDDARRDEEFRQWFQSVDAYSRKVLLEPGYVLEPMCNSEGRKVRDSGRRFYDEKYKAHFDRLFDSIGTWFSAMGEDPLNKRFGDDWARLTHDLLFDSEGSLKFKPQLWMDIRKVIVPSIVDRVRPFLPVFRTHSSRGSTGRTYPYSASRVHGRLAGSCCREPYPSGPNPLPNPCGNRRVQRREVFAVQHYQRFWSP